MFPLGFVIEGTSLASCRSHTSSHQASLPSNYDWADEGWWGGRVQRVSTSWCPHDKRFVNSTASFCAPSIRPDLCTSNHGCNVTCAKGFYGRASEAASRTLPILRGAVIRRPGSPQRRWKGNTPPIGVSAANTRSNPSLLPTICPLEQCPSNLSISLRRKS